MWEIDWFNFIKEDIGVLKSCISYHDNEVKQMLQYVKFDREGLQSGNLVVSEWYFYKVFVYIVSVIVYSINLFVLRV